MMHGTPDYGIDHTPPGPMLVTTTGVVTPKRTPKGGAMAQAGDTLIARNRRDLAIVADAI